MDAPIDAEVIDEERGKLCVAAPDTNEGIPEVDKADELLIAAAPDVEDVIKKNVDEHMSVIQIVHDE